MRRSFVAWTLVAIVAIAVWIPIKGQDESPDMTSELAGIREAVDRLAVEMSLVRRSENANLTLRQIELAELRVAPLEKTLTSYDREHMDHMTWLVESKESLERAKEKIEEARRQGADSVPEDLKSEMNLAAKAVEVHKSRAETIDGLRVELQNRIAEQREQIGILEERLRELLE